MSNEKHLLQKLSPPHMFVFCLTVAIASVAVLLCVLVGLGVLIGQGKIPATFSDVFSLILGIVAIVATIVFSRLSTDIREARERLQELVTSSETNSERMHETIRSAVERIETGNMTVQKDLLAGIRSEIQDLRGVVDALNRSTEIEKMLKSLSQRPSVPTELLEQKARTRPEGGQKETDHLAARAAHVHSHLSFDELAVLHVFAEANESVLSHGLFERYVGQKRVGGSQLRSSLEKLRQCECLTIYSTALSLTALGKAVVAAIELHAKNEIKSPPQHHEQSGLEHESKERGSHGT